MVFPCHGHADDAHTGLGGGNELDVHDHDDVANERSHAQIHPLFLAKSRSRELESERARSHRSNVEECAMLHDARATTRVPDAILGRATQWTI